MKKLLIPLIAIIIASFCTACGNSAELDALKKENDELKQQIAQTSSKPSSTEAPAFDSHNVVEFQLTNEDRTSYDEEVICTFTATNTLNEPIKRISATIAYYDANGNTLCTDSRTSDVMIEPGKFVTLKSYSSVDGNKDSVASADVISYEYVPTTEPAEGCNTVEVNLQTKEIKYAEYYY